VSAIVLRDRFKPNSCSFIRAGYWHKFPIQFDFDSQACN